MTDKEILIAYRLRQARETLDDRQLILTQGGNGMPR